MNKPSLLSALTIQLLFLTIVLSGCAATAPVETWKPVAMATTSPVHVAKKIYFVFDVSLENREKNSEEPLSSSSNPVQNWTAFATQLVKDVKAAGVDADFMISTDKLPPNTDKLKTLRVQNDVTHVVILTETRIGFKGRTIADAWWAAVVLQANEGKKWDEKRNYENISLYKYKYVGWDCFSAFGGKSSDVPCLKTHATFHIENLKKIGIL